MSVSLSQLALDGIRLERMLTFLDADRNLAGKKYIELQNGLIRFFERDHRVAHFDSLELAEEVFKRIANHLLKVDAGQRQPIENLLQYAFGIARFVLLEWSKRPIPQELPLNLAEESVDEKKGSELEVLRDRLDACLEGLPEKDRRFLLRYYENEKGAKIDNRRKMADELGVSLVTLRQRASRLKKKLEGRAQKIGANSGDAFHLAPAAFAVKFPQSA